MKEIQLRRAQLKSHIQDSFVNKESTLEKANHKYFKREGSPGNYKYYYTEEEYKKSKGGEKSSKPRSEKEKIEELYQDIVKKEPSLAVSTVIAQIADTRNLSVEDVKKHIMSKMDKLNESTLPKVGSVVQFKTSKDLPISLSKFEGKRLEVVGYSSGTATVPKFLNVEVGGKSYSINPNYVQEAQSEDSKKSKGGEKSSLSQLLSQEGMKKFKSLDYNEAPYIDDIKEIDLEGNYTLTVTPYERWGGGMSSTYSGTGAQIIQEVASRLIDFDDPKMVSDIIEEYGSIEGYINNWFEEGKGEDSFSIQESK